MNDNVKILTEIRTHPGMWPITNIVDLQHLFYDLRSSSMFMNSPASRQISNKEMFMNICSQANNIRFICNEAGIPIPNWFYKKYYMYFMESDKDYNPYLIIRSKL